MDLSPMISVSNIFQSFHPHVTVILDEAAFFYLNIVTCWAIIWHTPLACFKLEKAQEYPMKTARPFLYDELMKL